MPSWSGVRLLADREYVVELAGLPSAPSFAHLTQYPSTSSSAVHETGMLVGVGTPHTASGVCGTTAIVTMFVLTLTVSSGVPSVATAFH